MRAEFELIKKIQELRQIKPREDWVVLTKSQILGEEPKILFFPFFKPVLATVTAFGILFGIFSLAQNSLPGDILYSIKKITEKSHAVFVSETERPVFQLKLANERLEDLAKAPAKNLAPALNEFQNSISQAAKEIVKAKKPAVKEIVQQTKKLEENKQKIEALGIVVGDTKELEDSVNNLIGQEIKIWKAQIVSLSDELEAKELLGKLLDEAEKYYESGDYYQASQSLEKIYLSYPQP